MVVYRINDCRYIKDLSGRGAALYGARWNSKDIYMVYTAQSRALALLEAVVHIGKIPQTGYCLATIDIPDESILYFPAGRLPADWQTNPPPDYLKVIGDHFIKSKKHVAMAIPSALMVEEHNFLLNPAHAEFNRVKIINERPIKIDERLFPA